MPRQFDLNNYIDTQERINTFWSENPDGAIVTKLMSPPDDFTTCRYEAAVYRHKDDIRPSATGYAYEVAGTNPRDGANFGSHEENCECVPLTVRALTKAGWVYYHQLHEGDEILGFNQESGTLEWTRVLAVRSFGPQPLVQIGNSRFSAVATPNHRWVTSSGLLPWNESPKTSRATITLSAHMRESGGDTRAAAQLAWVFTDGHLRDSNGLPMRATITQSKEENFSELTNLFGDPSPANNPTVRDWGNGRVASPTLPAMRWSISSDRLRAVLGRFRVATMADLTRAVLSMTYNEATSFLGAAMRADGSRGVFAKTHLPIVEAVQMAMFVTGHCVGPIQERAGNDMTTKPCYTVSHHNTGYKYLSEFGERPLPPRPVWCPTTTLGTWVADFNGRFAITGNTSAIGRAMANLGMAKSRTDRPSRQEMGKVNRVNDQPPRNAPVSPSQPQGGAEPVNYDRQATTSSAQAPRTVDTSTGEILDEGPEDWTEFWRRARSNGYTTKEGIEKVIGQPMGGKTPAAVMALLDAAHPGASPPTSNDAQTKAMKRLHVVGAKRNLSHDDLHLLGLAAGFSSLTEMSAQELRNLGDWIEDTGTDDEDIAAELNAGQSRMDKDKLAKPIDSQTADWISAIEERNNLGHLEMLGQEMKANNVDGVAIWAAFAARRQALLKSAG
jgi:hypothetical protein